jgi:hypothetical protein
MVEKGKRSNNPGGMTMSNKKNQAMQRTRIRNARRQKAKIM